MTSITDEIRSRLAILEPVLLDIQDDSAKHAGHAGNTGGGHFNLMIVSSQFCGKSQIIRHRSVYQALEGMIPGRIHALSIQAIATDEPYRSH
ncbi:MAG TPA: BolA family protein [Methylophilaceae bacterium]|nr:BolA family protein [Methylophilaceae bacterium]